ncbi:MAG: hypothetical protein GXO90_05430 [FCB group bacterium]|nr:hypothetical protein [FCB group bacterium]
MYKARKMVEGYEKLGYQAINIGQYDFAAGPDFLTMLADSTEIPFLSANLVDDTTGKPLFTPYLILNEDGFRIGVIGLISRLPVNYPGLQLKDMVLTGKETIEMLKPKTDIIVVLVNVDSRKNRDLQDAFAGADYIFVSRGSLRSQPGQKQPRGGPYLYSSSIQGKYLSDIRLEITNLDSPIVDISGYQSTIKNVKTRFENLNKKDPSRTLEEVYADQPNTLRLISNYHQQLDIAERALAKAVNRSEFKLVPLNRKIKDDPEMLIFIDKVLAEADKLQGKPPVTIRSKAKVQRSMKLPGKRH